ncbi:MAG: hypothetical protein M1834_002112 [Cirrosporium novae-zelandiae]|nr:MAG: hypothetical protein M1834_002112 [Cirrosporium novae-zelandiae]
MPDRPLTVAAYAAGASLAAVTLVYVFGPTFFLDGEGSSAGKKGAVGLSNSANDCFYNSVLQALAGLGDLRTYLIREFHRRDLDGPEIYQPPEAMFGNDKRKALVLKHLEDGLVTRALKEMLDSLNQRTLYKKTISAQKFVGALEMAYQTRFSRQQQDAQEFLQVVTERLCDEYHAGCNARRRARSIQPLERTSEDTSSTERTDTPEQQMLTEKAEGHGGIQSQNVDNVEDEDGFPFEGIIESQIECQHCGYKTRPNSNTITVLTLNVPQQNSTTLSHCFDGMFKAEEIEDYKCEKCRLVDALKKRSAALGRAWSQEEKASIQSDIDKLEQAILEDPENPPPDLVLPDTKEAPKRRIKKYARLSKYPKIAAIHLSRSIYSVGSYSSKNAAKVSFPEALTLGGILDQHRYKLLAIVAHRGSHDSGHYETFRRQIVHPPFSTPNLWENTGPYSRTPSRDISRKPSPRLQAVNHVSGRDTPSGLPSLEVPDQTPSPRVPSPLSASPTETGTMHEAVSAHSASNSLKSPSSSTLNIGPQSNGTRPSQPSSIREAPSIQIDDVDAGLKKGRYHRHHKKKAANNRWWRISDEKVKECKTSEVLSFQREVYLLFYELDKGNGND